MKLLILFKHKYNVGDVVEWNGRFRVLKRVGYKHWLEKIEE